MSLIQKSDNLHQNNLHIRRSTQVPNTAMNLTKLTKNEVDNNDNSHFYKEPLDDISHYEHQSLQRRYHFVQSPQINSLKSSKFYIFNKHKPYENLVQVDLKNFKISDQKKITEKIPKNIKKVNISIPTDEFPITTKKRRENIIIKKTNTEYKTNDTILKMPIDNVLPSHKNQKINMKKNDNIFSVILKSQVKRTIENEKNNEKQYFNENIEENLKSETSRHKNKKKKYSEMAGNIQETNVQEKKVPKNKKEKKIKMIQIIDKDNNSLKRENSSKSKDKKEKINKENNLQNKDKNKQKKPNIIINIIKNDITKKVIIKKKSEEKVKTHINIQKIKSNKKESIIDKNVEIETHNSPQTKSIIIGINPLTKSDSDNKKKVYDITIDKILGDINMEQKPSKEKKEIHKINSKEKSIKIELKGPQDKNHNSNIKNKQLSNHQNSEIENNISKKASNENYPKDKENKNKNENKSIIQNITINNTIILNGKNNFKKTLETNKINKNNIKIIREIKENKENKGKIEKKNKKEEEQINYNFIKQTIQRYKDSPIKNIVRAKSEIFTKNYKRSSEFIFNKIISSLEKPNEIITYTNNKPINKNIYTGYNFKPSDFKYLGVLGEGEYGKIYLVQWVKNDNQLYAMKIEKYEYFEEAKNIQNITHIIKDFEEKTNSSGIIKIYGDICLNNNNIYYYYTLMERCERDAEQECIIRNNYQTYFTEQNLIDILCQLIITCSSLQKHSICHGDIKPQNILILNGIYKLTDFGEVKITNPKEKIEQEIRGTELYMSPILFFAMKKKQNYVVHNPYKSDVFSLALCMLLLATFNYDSLVKIREVVDMSVISNIVNGFLSVRYSKNFIAFLMPMLEVDENKRPDFIDLENKLVKNNA